MCGIGWAEDAEAAERGEDVDAFWNTSPQWSISLWAISTASRISFSFTVYMRYFGSSLLERREYGASRLGISQCRAVLPFSRGKLSI
jgi:hypothetical protein